MAWEFHHSALLLIKVRFTTFGAKSLNALRTKALDGLDGETAGAPAVGNRGLTPPGEGLESRGHADDFERRCAESQPSTQLPGPFIDPVLAGDAGFAGNGTDAQWLRRTPAVESRSSATVVLRPTILYVRLGQELQRHALQ